MERYHRWGCSARCKWPPGLINSGRDDRLTDQATCRLQALHIPLCAASAFDVDAYGRLKPADFGYMEKKHILAWDICYSCLRVSKLHRSTS